MASAWNSLKKKLGQAYDTANVLDGGKSGWNQNVDPNATRGLDRIRDVFDANSTADRASRIAKGRASSYSQDQADQGYGRDNNSFGKRFVNTFKSAGEGIAQPYKYLSKGLAESLAFDTKDQTAARDSQNALLDQYVQGMSKASNVLKDPSLTPEARARWQKLYDLNVSGMDELNAEMKKRNDEIIAATDPKKGAASVVSIGTDVITAGVGTGGVQASKQAAKQGSKALAKNLIVQGVKTGAINVPSGVAGAYVQKGEDTTLKDAAIGGATAFGVGAIIPTVSYGASSGKNKLVRMLTKGGTPEVKASALPTGTQVPGMPEGYVMDNQGSVFSPEGKELTLGEVQTIRQNASGEAFLSEFEQASNRGDKATMARIAKEHPGDNRVQFNVKEDTVKVTPPSEGKTVKVVKTGIKDAQLDNLVKARQSVIDVAAEEKLATANSRNLTKEVLDNGGISSSAYETLPKGTIRKTGMSADKMAQVLGFDSEDSFIEALNGQTKKLTRREAVELAEQELASGKHPYSPDFAEMETALKARQDELSLYPQGKRGGVVKVTKNAPAAPTDAELLSLQAPDGTPRVTKYSQVKAKPIIDPETDRLAQELVKNGASRDEIAKLYMDRNGSVFGDALKDADRIRGFTTPSPNKTVKVVKAGDPVDITGKPMKNAEMKAMMQDISNAKNLSEVDAKVTAAEIQSVARKAGVDIADPGFIQRYQTGTITDKSEAEVAAVIKKHTDRTFEIQQALDPTIEYRQNYLPQSYSDPENVIEDAARRLQTSTGAAQKRAFSTFDEARQYGLNPKYKSVDQMVADNVRQAQAAISNREVINNGIERGIFSTKPADKSWKAVEGFSLGGEPVYASPKAANTINNALQDSTDALSKTVKGAGKLNANWQDIMLAGGVPYSPANFFVFGQAVKELTAGRVSVAKDLVLSFSDKLTKNRFAESADFVREMAERGVPFNIKNPISDESWLSKNWGNAINKPTFERFMPNQYLSVAENTYKSAIKKGMEEGAAKDLAASTVKTYYGVVDQIAQGRSTNVQNAINAAFFAPRYRESIINTLFNTGKSIVDPRTWGDKSYIMNRRLAAGMAVTLVAAEMLQRKISGHGLLENREGQEASIEIGVGKDEKGNDKVINIPLMPGFLSMPRAAIRGIQGALNGEIMSTDPNKPSVVGEATKFLSTPLQTAGRVATNADYFGNPIYTDQATADNEGINPDKGLDKARKIAGYVGGQLMPGYGRAIKDAVNDKSGLQVTAQALELPIRFGKKLDPKTAAYFKDRDEVYEGLDKNSKAVWDAIHPKLKNKNGEYMTDPTVDSGLARASNYLNNPKVLEAENEMARRAKARGEQVDPLFELDGEKQRIALRMETLPPKDPNKKKLVKDNPWYDQFSKDRSAFYDSLPAGDPNKPGSPIPYPEASPEVESIRAAYNQLEDPTQKRELITRNPELADQFAKEEQYSRAVRAAKDLPQYDQYPEPTPEVQKLIDEYSALPKGEGAGGKSPTRSAWIKSHPNEWAKMTDQFSKQAVYNLQEDVKLSQYEGEDLTDKGIKAISSLARSIESSQGGYGGGSGGSSTTGLKGGDFGSSQAAPTIKVTPVKAKSVKVVRKTPKVIKVVRSKR